MITQTQVLSLSHGNVRAELASSWVSLMSKEAFYRQAFSLDEANWPVLGELFDGKLGEKLGEGISTEGCCLRLETGGVIFVVRFPAGRGKIDTSYEAGTNGEIIISERHTQGFRLIERRALHYRQGVLTVGGDIGISLDPITGRESSEARPHRPSGLYTALDL